MYEVGEEMYNMLKQRGVSYYNGHSLIKRSVPKLTRQEWNEKIRIYCKRKYVVKVYVLKIKDYNIYSEVI